MKNWRHVLPQTLTFGALVALLSAPSITGSSAQQAASDITTTRQLSAKLAMEALEAALEACAKDNLRVSVAVVDRSGLVRGTIRGDGSGPHTHESAIRKAYTAASFGALTSDLARRVADPATATLRDIPGVLMLGGGVPIRVGNEVVGGIGVAGAPSGAQDETCANAGVAKIQDRLK
jgi:uncharacterized protein GlcG (DUF336 family)